jgi:uncharacterized membrane protein YeaQ/YmgE (transglycosylase-associated protein family)
MGGKKDADETQKPENPISPDEVEPLALGPDTPIQPDEQPLGGDKEGQTGVEEGEDHGLGAGSEEDGSVPPGAGVPADEIIPPAAESALTLPPFSEDAYQPPSPTSGSIAPLQPEALPADPEIVTKFVTDDRLDALWVRADTAKIELDGKVHTLAIARALLDQILYARNYLLAGRQYFEEAERHINEVEFRIFQNFQSRKWSMTVGIPLFLYEVICAVALVLLYLGLNTPVFSGFSEAMRGMIATMVCGGLGGVVGAWLALIKHISQEQDFDKQHTLWYLNSPFMGAAIGIFIYWIVRAGMISLTAGQAESIASPYVIYILAWLAGYQHNVFTSIVRRILKILEIGVETREEAKTTEKPSEAPRPPSTMLPGSGAEGSEEGPSKRK